MRRVFDFIKGLLIVIGAMAFVIVLLAVIFSPVWVPIWFGYEIIVLLTALIDKI